MGLIMIDDLDTITIHAICQFLRNNDLHETADVLMEESGVEENGYTLKKFLKRQDDATDVLREAMTIFVDHNQKSTSTEDQDEIEELRKQSAPCTSVIDTITFSKNVIALEFMHSFYNSFLKVNDSEVITAVAPFNGIELYATDLSTQEHRLLSFIQTPSPILTLDVPEDPYHPLIVAGCMGGELLLIDVETCEIIKTEKCSFTHVNSVRFTADGSKVAVVCRNNMVIVYAIDSESKDFQKLWVYSSETSPTSAEWLSSGDLIISRMSSSHLTIFDGKDGMKKREISLNGIDGGKTTIFNALNIRRLPNSTQYSGKELMSVATDQGRIILIDVEGGRQLRNYFGMETGQFAQIFTRFSHDGSSIVANAYAEGSFISFNTHSTERTSLIQEHKGVVRCIATHPQRPIWASGSFDKTVKIYAKEK
eukprot:GDKJ01058742.1.p1 GENE.GDKJ01058742.1~~GDKJ01058742.1.p1  ORF type:complete len:423 (+),score=71.34 GDKJ01058742.1:1-1269(+)